MEKKKSPWPYYLIVFFSFAFLNFLVRLWNPGGELRDGNLLVNFVITLILTLVFFGIRYCWRKAVNS